MAKTEWLKKTLPQGFKKEFLGPEQQSHRISRGRDFLNVPGRAFTVHWYYMVYGGTVLSTLFSRFWKFGNSYWQS